MGAYLSLIIFVAGIGAGATGMFFLYKNLLCKKDTFNVNMRKLRTVERFDADKRCVPKKEQPLYRLDPYTLSPLLYINTPNTVNTAAAQGQIITDQNVNRTNIQFTANR